MAIPSNPFDSVPHPLGDFSSESQLKEAAKKAAVLPHETIHIALVNVGYSAPSRWRLRLGAWLIRLMVRSFRLTPSVKILVTSTVHFPGYGPVTRQRANDLGGNRGPVEVDCFPFFVMGEPTMAAHIRNSLHAHKN